MVSIYNNNFTTPESRVPYFIEVYRCVNGDDGCSASMGYSVPSNKTEIEIVVPDLTNNYREGPKRFYKYVVYNHTSCECGKNHIDEKELYKTITNNNGKIRKTRMTA